VVKPLIEEETKEVSPKPATSVHLRKNHFKEQTSVQITAPIIEHSKQKHQHVIQKTKWHTDDSAQDSWRVEYSDKGGSDGDEVFSKLKPLKNKTPKKLKPVMREESDKTQSADGDQVQAEVKKEDSVAYESEIVEKRPKAVKMTARLSKKD